MNVKTNKQLMISFLFCNLLIFFDQITKKAAQFYLKGNDAIPIIKDVFELKYLENTSAAFGMDPISLLHRIFQFQIFNENPELYLNVRMGFFYLITVLVILLLVCVYTKVPNEPRFRFMDYVLLFLKP